MQPTRAKFAAERVLQEGLAEISCSGNVFASIAGISATRLSQALSGQAPLEGPLAIRLLDVLSRMKRLQASVAPIPVSFRRAELIRALIFSEEGGAE